MNAKQAIDNLDPQKWAETPPAERLALLEAVRDNLKRFGDELAASDTRMKNALMGEELFTDPSRSKIHNGVKEPLADHLLHSPVANSGG